MYLIFQRLSEGNALIFMKLSVQEKFDLITSFIQESEEKNIPSKTSRSSSSAPWIIPEITRALHAVPTLGSSCFKKFLSRKRGIIMSKHFESYLPYSHGFLF